MGAMHSAAGRITGTPFRQGYGAMRLVVLVVFMMMAPVLAAADEPLNQLRSDVDTILQVLRTPDIPMALKQEKITEIASRKFSFRDMAQLTLATNWKKATQDERRRFIELFTRLLNQTYLASISDYVHATVTYRSEKITGTRAMVETVVLNNGVETPVSYRLRKHSEDGSWWVYDVVIEGVSLISTYRTEYLEIVKNSGIDGLLDQLEKKLNTQNSTQRSPAA